MTERAGEVSARFHVGNVARAETQAQSGIVTPATPSARVGSHLRNEDSPGCGRCLIPCTSVRCVGTVGA